MLPKAGVAKAEQTIASQVTPLPKYPALHAQEKDPGELVQVAKEEQLSKSRAHSSTSVWQRSPSH